METALSYIALFVLIFSILYIIRIGYSLFMAVYTNGKRVFVHDKYTNLFVGLALSYIITYILC